MKTLFLTLVLFFGLTGLVFATPFLVCDPQPNTDEFVLMFDGIEEIVPYNDAGGYVVLKDLAGITDGDHDVSVKAVNMWGQSSEVPFAFVKALPGVAGNVRLKK